MKKVHKLLLCFGLLASMSACSSAETNENGEEMIQIGVLQQAKHPALDEAYEGFKAALADNGYAEEDRVTYNYQDAQGDPSNCETIANNFVSDNVDMILAIGTSAAQSAAAKTTEIPIIVTAVTDPQSSGLVESNEAPGGNVTGTSDLNPIDEQIDLLQEMFPDAENIAILYNGSEDNSIFQAEMAKQAIEERGMTAIEQSISELNQIQQVVESMVGNVDAIYIPTDNMLAEGMATVAMITNDFGIPTIVGEEGMVSNGGLATYGLDYYNLGYMAGEQAAAILNGEAEPATTPIGYLPAEECTLVINQTTADAIGFEISEELASRAVIVE